MQLIISCLGYSYLFLFAMFHCCVFFCYIYLCTLPWIMLFISASIFLLSDYTQHCCLCNNLFHFSWDPQIAAVPKQEWHIFHLHVIHIFHLYLIHVYLQQESATYIKLYFTFISDIPGTSDAYTPLSHTFKECYTADCVLYIAKGALQAW